MKRAWAFAAAYFAVLCVFAPRLSLWLDEVLTVIVATQPDLSHLFDQIRGFAGGTPLVFLPPRWSMALFGPSDFAARLPSMLASAASIPAVYRLARILSIRKPMLAVVLFAAMPLQLRYALEARPYALALCLTLWMTVAFLRQWSGAAYASLAIAAVLAQPYAIFVPVAHAIWALLRDRGRARVPLAAIAASALVIGPWYAYFRADWGRVVGEQNLVNIDFRAPLVFLHEISGSGYAGAVLLLAGAALALRVPGRNRAFWLCCMLVPIGAVWLANAAAHYFFAVRQVIYVLPVLTLLFTLGSESLRPAGQVLIGVLLSASLYEDVRWFQKPREDWRAAADAAAMQLGQGGCVQFLGDSTPLYLYFRPELDARRCTETASRVVLAVTPYGGAADYAEAVAGLASRRLRKRSEQDFAGPRIEVFAP